MDFLSTAPFISSSAHGLLFCAPSLQGFKLKWMIFGMWLGMTIALAVIAVVIFVIFARIDWDEEVRKAQDRVGSDEPIVVGH